MDQNFHLIEKYFQGKLSQDELQLFNEKLQKDSAFEQEFRDMKLIRDAVKETSRTRALDILQNAEANLTNQETTKINVSMKRLVSIAASLLIVATVSYFAFSGGTGALTGEEIVANYYEVYPNLGGPVRGETSEIITLSARAYNAYDIEDYSTSADLFSSLLNEEKTVKNYFYSGIANLEAGNLDAAKNNFNTVLNNFSGFNEQAQWYLAMTLFKEKEDGQALSNIASLSLSSSSSSYVKSAKDVLKAMNFVLTKETEGGEVIEEALRPPGVEEDGKPSGDFLDLRQYQEGRIKSLTNNLEYEFFNDTPIWDLKEGDLVDFVLLQTQKGKKSKVMAVIIGR